MNGGVAVLALGVALLAGAGGYWAWQEGHLDGVIAAAGPSTVALDGNHDLLAASVTELDGRAILQADIEVSGEGIVSFDPEEACGLIVAALPTLPLSSADPRADAADVHRVDMRASAGAEGGVQDASIPVRNGACATGIPWNDLDPLLLSPLDGWRSYRGEFVDEGARAEWTLFLTAREGRSLSFDDFDPAAACRFALADPGLRSRLMDAAAVARIDRVTVGAGLEPDGTSYVFGQDTAREESWTFRVEGGACVAGGGG